MGRWPPELQAESRIGQGRRREYPRTYHWRATCDHDAFRQSAAVPKLSILRRTTSSDDQEASQQHREIGASSVHHAPKSSPFWDETSRYCELAAVDMYA